MEQTNIPGNIVDERNSEYGDAWRLHGIVVKCLDEATPALRLFLINFPGYWYPWMMILNKLIRALTSPAKLDNWIDIQGYAELVLRDLRGNNDITTK